MATKQKPEAKPELAFNGEKISEADALKKLIEIYGDKRPAADIIPGLFSGKYSHASVAEGHIAVFKPEPAAAAETKPS